MRSSVFLFEFEFDTELSNEYFDPDSHTCAKHMAMIRRTQRTVQCNPIYYTTRLLLLHSVQFIIHDIFMFAEEREPQIT